METESSINNLRLKKCALKITKQGNSQKYIFFSLDTRKKVRINVYARVYHDT